MSVIEITDKISIVADELVFTFSRSSGPGGQNVNKVNTKVTVLLDVANCRSFSDSQKRQIIKHLSTRINKDGVLRVFAQKYRTQKANRNAAVQRLTELLQAALKKKTPRRKTAMPYASRQRRLEEKKRRSTIKKLRTKKISDLD